MLKTTALALALAAFTLPAWAAPAPSTSVAPSTPRAKPDAAAAAKTAAATQRIANRSVILCYTCGGNYPIRAKVAGLGGYNWVWEYGSGCGGSLRFRWDSNPYLCASRN